MHNNLIRFGILLFLPLLIIPACSTNQNQALRNELSGRGPLNLDFNNPYLAPNKFLSEETKTSETLKGFLSLKGAPEILEFSDPIIGTTSLKLIYKSKNESYMLEEHSHDWIISGPFKVEESLEEESLAKNELLIGSNNYSTPAILDLDKNNSLVKPSEQGSTTPTLPIKNPTNNDSVKNTSEISSKPSFKDIYHQVNFPGQTLTFLSSWYTGNILNTERLKRINSSLSENLKSGDIVRIPSYLTNKDNPPSLEDLEKFISGN